MQKILLIDDDATMRSLLKTLLELDNYQVIFPSELTETAIQEAILSQLPQLLLVDVLMQNLNGLDLVAGLPSVRPYRILMTSGMDVGIECSEAGADGFLLKPYDPSELIRRIQELTAEN